MAAEDPAVPGGPTIRESLEGTRRLLERAGDAHAALSAEWLVGWAAKRSRTQLYLDADEPLALAERSRLLAATARRAAGEPLQYITGSAPFRTLEVACAPGVLIPRPETELLAEIALEALDARPGGAEGARVLELGTGTGCVACSLAAERPGVFVWATDLAPEAVALARENARDLGLAGRVAVLEGDLADPVPPGLLGSFDVLVSNPPYVPSAVVDGLDAEVRCHEPRLALDGGADGLDVFRRILEIAPAVLAPGGTLAVELFEESLDDARDLARAQGVWSSVEARPDLTGRPRFLVARLEGEPHGAVDPSGAPFPRCRGSDGDTPVTGVRAPRSPGEPPHSADDGGDSQ